MKSCLIVDDSKVIRKVARHILETMQFEVAEAVDGKEALDHVAQIKPDVILLDWNMPIMSGMEIDGYDALEPLYMMIREPGGGARAHKARDGPAGFAHRPHGRRGPARR